MNADEARKVLEAERRERLEACQAALTALLAEHKCRLTGTPRFTADGRIGCEIGLAPVETNAD